MFARVTVVEAAPDRVEEGIRYVRDEVIPRTKVLQGFKGGYWLTDRKAARTMGVTLWESEAAVTASEPIIARLRDEGTKPRGTRIVSVEVYEVTNQA